MVYLFQNNSPIFENMKQSFTLIFESESYDNLCQNNETGFTWKLAGWVENISVSFNIYFFI